MILILGLFGWFLLIWWGCFEFLMLLFNRIDGATNVEGSISVAGGISLLVAWIMFYYVLPQLIEKILRNFFKNEILEGSFVFIECLVLFFLCLVTKSLLAKAIIFIVITTLAGFILSDFGQNKIRRIISRKNK